MSIFGRIFGSSVSTLKGLFVGLGTGAAAGTVAAAQQFMQTGNVTDASPYIVAAISAAIPAVVGGV